MVQLLQIETCTQFRETKLSNPSLLKQIYHASGSLSNNAGYAQEFASKYIHLNADQKGANASVMDNFGVQRLEGERKFAEHLHANVASLIKQMIKLVIEEDMSQISMP